MLKDIFIIIYYIMLGLGSCPASHGALRHNIWWCHKGRPRLPLRSSRCLVFSFHIYVVPMHALCVFPPTKKERFWTGVKTCREVFVGLALVAVCRCGGIILEFVWFCCLMCVCLANAHGLSALTLNFIFICRFSFKFACVRKMRFEGWMYVVCGIEPRAR